MIACTNAAVLPFLAHRTATVSGSTATALATGGIIAIANCGGISAPFLFPSNTGPQYRRGNWTVFAFLATSVFITTYLGWRLGTGSEYRDVKQTAGVGEIRKNEEEVSKAEGATTTLKDV